MLKRREFLGCLTALGGSYLLTACGGGNGTPTSGAVANASGSDPAAKAMAVANARDEVKEESHVVTKHRGGEGAARDAVEFILRAQNRLEEVIDQYIATRPAAQKAVPSK